jgi:xanthine dehydrogenase accessory factor
MAFTPDGKVSGSVSGGCIEAAVFEAGVETLKTGRPQLLHFGVADETAWEVGLACGGQIEVFVKPLEPASFERVRAALEAGRRFAVASLVRGPQDLLGRELFCSETEVLGVVGGGLDDWAAERARQALGEGRSQRFFFEWENSSAELFVDVIHPELVLIIVGGVHIAITLASLAKALGYSTVVIDPRRAFGSQERFPHADRLIQAWPDEAFAQLDLTPETAIAMLTHDPKIDDPALKIALQSPAFYIGALGSRQTHEKRRRRLEADGLTPAQLDRLHAPIGLEIGAETPEEIALAVLAEVVAARHGLVGQEKRKAGVVTV